jgi:hypothetical protein
VRPSAAAILEKAFRSTVVESGEPSSAEVALVQKILDDPKMPAVAEKGMGYIVHWADGRAIFAVRKKANLMPWLKKAGEMAEVVSIKYGKAEHKGKKLKVTEAEDPTQTPAFKAWFGKSRVVGKDGKPLRVYHGTETAFNEFKPHLSDMGIHFGTTSSANQRLEDGGNKEGSRIIPVYLRIEKPLRTKDAWWTCDSMETIYETLSPHLKPADRKQLYADMYDDNMSTQEVFDQFTIALEKVGYDGIVYSNKGEDVGSDSYMIWEPTQAKSAIGNKGTFNPIVPDLTEGTAHIPGLLLEAAFTARDIDLDKTYGTFKASYEKQTGKAWDKAKFLDRIKDWTLYGDHDGFVAARQQASGPIKLVGAAGNPIGVKKGFQEVLAAGKPVWGAMDLRLATLAARMGLKMPPAWLMVRILTAIKDRFAAASGLEPSAIQVNKDGSLTITYPDVGAATKFIVGNKKYFEWLLKTHGSALPAMLRTAISYFLTTGKPPPQPADQDEEPFTLDDKPPVPPTPPDTEVSDAPPQEAVQR